jgi:hypothetical protein
VTLKISRKKIVCALLATLFTIQSNLACLATTELVEPLGNSAAFAIGETSNKIAYGHFTLNGPLGAVPAAEENANAETNEALSGEAPQLTTEAPVVAQSPVAEQFTSSRRSINYSRRVSR